MHGDFGLAGTYQRDPGAELQRWHRERIAREEREERAIRWLADHTVGQVFHSFESLRYAAIRTFETLRGRPATEQENQILTNAARALWSGISLRARTQITLTDTGHVASLTILRAA
jgi:hypothetical protein